MNRHGVTKLANDLAAVIERLVDLQIDLHAVVREKLEAMRRADVQAMLAAAQREGETVSQASTLDEQRRSIVSKLSQALDLRAAVGDKDVTLRELAERLDAPARCRLDGLARRLREEMLKLAEANRVVELVCREMLAHFKAVFSAMVHGGDAAPIYSADGEVGPAAGARVLDAMG